MKNVIGDAAFGSQCPYGFLPDPKPVKLGLWDCPIAMNEIELTTPPSPLLFQADCHKMTLSIRTQDRKFDSFWEVMPDGTFDLMLAGGEIGVKSDGMGGGECHSNAALEVWGKLKCTDRDKVVIQVNSLWWLGKGKAGTPNARKLRTCQLPANCYLHAAGEINQCS